MKDAFKEHLTRTDSLLELSDAGPKGPPYDNVLGHEWHSLLKNYITKKNDAGNLDQERAAKSLILQLNERYGIKCLDSDFPLYGYMHRSESELSREVYFWSGHADAIGMWFNEERKQNEYVIVDWKVKRDLLNFWESGETYRTYLHQCLVYAKLLSLQLDLNYLPSLVIVPIAGEDGKIFHPGHFTDYPDESKTRINVYYSWHTKFHASLPLRIYGKKSLFKEEVLTKALKEDGQVSGELQSIFAEGATVKDLLEALGMSGSSLKIIKEK